MDNQDYKIDTQRTVDLEQTAAELENIGKLIATYYQSLAAEGLPERLVGGLVFDLSNLLLVRLADTMGKAE